MVIMKSSLKVNNLKNVCLWKPYQEVNLLQGTYFLSIKRKRLNDGLLKSRNCCTTKNIVFIQAKSSEIRK